MAKQKGENTKKAAGNARKAEAAARKQAEVDAKMQAADDEFWSDGSKNKPSKKELEAKKAEEARAKKAAREKELEEETAAIAKKKPLINQKKANKQSAVPRSSGLDAALAASSGEAGELHAHNIDDAIAALEITTGKDSDKIDRHPERRFKPALRAYEERRLPEMKEEHPGLRKNQYQQRIFEEFQKSPENPFNQVKAAYNASKDEIAATRESARKSKEERLKH